MNKRGQITLFVILAIIVVGVILAIVYFKSQTKTSNELTLQQTAQGFRNNLDICVKESSNNALLIISSQGGYIVPDNYFSDNIMHIAYWYDKGIDISPNIEKVDSEISDYTCFLINKCLNSINYTFKIDEGNCTVKATIKDDYTILNINYPIKATIGENTYNFKKFTEKISLRLGKAYSSAKSIVSEQTKHPDSICLTCIADLGESNNMKIDIGSQNDTYVVSIKDQTLEISKYNYTFKFAMRIK